MVVASEIGCVELALTVIRSSEFPSPDDQCVLKQSALFQVRDQGIGCLIGFLALTLDAAGQSAMLVPTGGRALSIEYFQDMHLRDWAENRVYGPLADGGLRSLSRFLFLLGPYFTMLGLRILLYKFSER